MDWNIYNYHLLLLVLIYLPKIKIPIFFLLQVTAYCNTIPSIHSFTSVSLQTLIFEIATRPRSNFARIVGLASLEEVTQLQKDKACKYCLTYEHILCPRQAYLYSTIFNNFQVSKPKSIQRQVKLHNKALYHYHQASKHYTTQMSSLYKVLDGIEWSFYQEKDVLNFCKLSIKMGSQLCIAYYLVNLYNWFKWLISYLR